MKKKVIEYIFKNLIGLLKLYLLLKPNPIFKRENVSRVLVFAHTTGLGNFIMYTPTIKAIKNYLPNASFTLLHDSNTGCYQVVKDSKLFEKYVNVKRGSNLIEMLKWIYLIRKEKYDLLINEFHNSSLFIILLTIFSGAQYRLGHVSGSGWIHTRKWDWIYNIPIEMKKNQHEIDRGLELARGIGVDIKKIDKKPFIYLTDKDREFADNFFSNNSINKNHKVVSIQIGRKADNLEKHWSTDKYSKICDKILEYPNLKVILHGAPNEYHTVNKVVSKMNRKPTIAAGKTTIKQAAAILEKSDVLICDDSGLMHMAVAVGTPVVAIFGPTDYTRTAPYGKDHVMIRKNLKCSPCSKIDMAPNKRMRIEQCPYNYKCIKDISVDDVFKIIKKKLLN